MLGWEVNLPAASLSGDPICPLCLTGAQPALSTSASLRMLITSARKEHQAGLVRPGGSDGADRNVSDRILTCSVRHLCLLLLNRELFLSNVGNKKTFQKCQIPQLQRTLIGRWFRAFQDESVISYTVTEQLSSWFMATFCTEMFNISRRWFQHDAITLMCDINVPG